MYNVLGGKFDCVFSDIHDKCIIHECIMCKGLVITHSFQSIEVIIECAETFPSIVTPIRPSHEILQNQANVNQSDLVIWR